jgi:hypothetical protein
LSHLPIDIAVWVRNHRAIIEGQQTALPDIIRIVQVWKATAVHVLLGSIAVSRKPPFDFAIGKPKDESRFMGRLSAKIEAAGKVRVFAIVDSITQILLRPFHDFLMKGLRRFGPNDATHDQNKGVEDFGRYCRERKLPMYSFDLKSATDLIPNVLYRLLFSPLIGEARASSWLSLLVDRDYMVGDPKRKGTAEGFHPASPPTVRYGTGQPIGALSSWASLAWVHHALVHFAAQKVGFRIGTFRDYIVLGDDIVIANTEVATSYQEVASTFSIPIGLAKSYISPEKGVFNFANRMFVDWTTDVSPISIREEYNITNVFQRVEIVRRMIHRFPGQVRSVADVLKWTTHPGRYLRLYPEMRQGASRIGMWSPLHTISTMLWYPHPVQLDIGIPALTCEPLSAILNRSSSAIHGLSRWRDGLPIVRKETVGGTIGLIFNACYQELGSKLHACRTNIISLSSYLRTDQFDPYGGGANQTISRVLPVLIIDPEFLEELKSLQPENEDIMPGIQAWYTNNHYGGPISKERSDLGVSYVQRTRDSLDRLEFERMVLITLWRNCDWDLPTQTDLIMKLLSLAAQMPTVPDFSQFAPYSPEALALVPSTATQGRELVNLRILDNLLQVFKYSGHPVGNDVPSLIRAASERSFSQMYRKVPRSYRKKLVDKIV